MPQKTVILHIHNPDDTSDIDFALITLDASNIQGLLKLQDTAQKIKAKHPDLYSLSFWDYTLHFISWETVENLDPERALAEEAELHSQLIVDRPFSIPRDQQEEVDCPQIVVCSDEIYWEALSPDTGTHFETATLTREQLLQMLNELGQPYRPDPPRTEPETILLDPRKTWARCESCDHIFPYTTQDTIELLKHPDIALRLTPGDPVPAAECPSCHALALPLSPDTTYYAISQLELANTAQEGLRSIQEAQRWQRQNRNSLGSGYQIVEYKIHPEA